MSQDDQVINKIISLIEDAYNPRETRKIIDEEFPNYDNSKLKTLIPLVLAKFDKKKQAALKKMQFFKYFMIGEDKIKKG